MLKNRLAQVIPDKDILKLLFHTIDRYRNFPNRGLSMCNQTSRLFALYYLDSLDRFIKEKLQIKHYVRYMDDLILLSDDKELLAECLKRIKIIVDNHLKLEFNDKTQIFPVRNGVDFLGFHFYLTDFGKVIKKLRRYSKVRFKNRLKQLQHEIKTGKVHLKDINMSLASYHGHLNHGHTYKLRTHVFSNIKFSKPQISDKTAD